MEVSDIVLIPVIIGLTEILKMYGLPKKLIPIFSLLLGIGGGIFYLFPHDWKSGILGGIIMGLSASGLYSSGKTIVRKPPCDEEDEQ
ncbi:MULTISPECIES: hypothetical protein [unclassified Sporosarcina]|uniref:hypothetical protein n=1 Tax=unclassified Sporosarcina TaxID=2647733 RepID=UPI000C1714EB|nr:MULTISPECIES: hypothetical protein [unclassified Sporosarcina]PIC97873.1 hypothetical protein CSV68_16090 [Sporosarcina sp. P29]PID05488.1 hypothetical protein CSV66_09720 [Sporosarcina sp. P30]PID08671.1 hypothetical protein CSV65_09645 [Sporosarcina sp. P31]PID11673.1 hypothetical protein CSV64_10610 [Sporosarcina sp. P32b]